MAKYLSDTKGYTGNGKFPTFLSHDLGRKQNSLPEGSNSETLMKGLLTEKRAGPREQQEMRGPQKLVTAEEGNGGSESQWEQGLAAGVPDAAPKWGESMEIPQSFSTLKSAASASHQPNPRGSHPSRETG